MKLKWGSKKMNEMDVVGHLTELRNRLIVTFSLFILFFIAGFIFVEDLYAFFMDDIDMELMVISPSEIIWIYFRMAGLVAIAGIIPVLAYEIWAFVKPALTAHERKISLSYIPFLFLLFLGGLAFGYTMFIHLIFPFILSFSGGLFKVMLTVGGYFTFLFRITLPFAILFELPVITMFLTTLGILTPDYMIKIRKYAYFILIIICTMLTPPDFIMPIIVSLPLILLYEVSIHLSKIVMKKRDAGSGSLTQSQ
ncbi:twin-arginine translocase subunit TatC [Oceanobacillus senegalensis]|uniref:twin-arginine translocase subunit TatC n=1 Tax=Oceanobacillus senegalensis TaxID=1936063 RepID=UPI000A30CD38|nr:twin-arginine translocase subunit TatC [Oceanobacillus senegalensis]